MRGREQVRHVVDELSSARRAAGVSQAAVAKQLNTSQSEISRLERLTAIDDVGLVRLAELSAVLGFDLSIRLFPNGDRLIDRGHQALIARFTRVLARSWIVRREVPLPSVGDRRSWDLVLRSPEQLVGVEAETRIRDIQRLTRHIRERERDGGVDVIVLALADSAVNRRLVPELLEALGPEFRMSARAILRALRGGQPLAGSGVVLL
jgi:transcriptional regulator with XRE-family HTH domain